MQNLNLTLDEAKRNSACFLYVFAKFKVNGIEYLSYIDKKHRSIILGKRANQQKVLLNSARAYINSKAQFGGTEYNQYVDAVRSGFKDTYGIEPEQALIDLAKGKTVAGKNWNEGVYGIGALKNEKFNNVQVDGKDFTVDPVSGHIFWGTQDVTDEGRTVYGDVNGKTIAVQFFSKSVMYNTFMSQYDKISKKYYAQSYESVNGSRYDSSGKEISKDSASSIWENVNFNWDSFLSWIMSILEKLFGGNAQQEQEKDPITSNNTLMNQQKDGFVYESGLGEAGAIALALVAGGTLLAGGFGKKKNKK